MLKIILVFLLCVSSLWATSGQSLKLNSGQSAQNTSVVAQALNGACRVETQFTFTTTPSDAQIMYSAACDTIMYFNGGNIAIYPFDTGPNYPACCYSVSASSFPSNFVMLRFQIVPSGTTSGTLLWEFWDINGNLVATHNVTYSTLLGTARSNGTYVTSGSQNLSWGFFRLFTTNVALGSKPPTFADTGNLLEWRFNNSLADASGNSYTASGVSPIACGSAPCYETSLGQTLVKAVIASRPVADLPSWLPAHAFGGTWDTTGSCSTAPRFLDSNNSYTWSEAGGQPTAVWSSLSGPNTPSITTSTAVTSTVSGLAFGTYNIQLVASDSSGNMGTSTQEIGAVPMNSQCSIVPADTNVTKAFNAQIGFGQNPWGYQDERALTAMELQIANNPYYASATWLTTGQGTISYPFAGKGPAPGTACTTLSSDITATTLSIPVTDASCLSLSSLPTVILIGNSAGSVNVPTQEAIRICSAPGTTGAQTLTVCYDGRGVAASSISNATTAPASIHSSGDTVGEYRIQGTSTKFITDPDRPLCPAGAPGPMGAVVYSTGSAQLGASSTTVTGIGTTWITGNTWVGYSIRVTATHASGSSFVWWAMITAVSGTGTLTVNRPTPSDVDTGTNFSYKITGILYPSLEFKNSNNTWRMLQNGVSCESETAAFGLVTHDVAAFNSTTQSGIKYSWKTTLGAGSQFGPNFYGTGLAAREFYYRSGWTQALTLANQIDENWVRDPEIAGGYAGGSPLLLGGGTIGGMLDLTLNTSTVLNWYDVSQFATGAIQTYAPSSCNAEDQRDSAYPLAWTAIPALFDTDMTRNAAWLAGLTTWFTRENTCRRSTGYSGVQVNSWGSSFNFNPGQSPAVTLVSGSTAVVPTVAGTLVPGMCAGVDDGTGTISVTGGSTSATVVSGSVAANGVRIYIVDTSVSPAQTVAYQYSGSGGAASTITLAGVYPNSGTHTYKFMVEDTSLNANWTSIGVDSNQADSTALNLNLALNWACKYNNSNSIILNRGWIAPTGVSGPYTTYHFSNFNVGPGFEAQPYMLGIKAAAFTWASRVADATIAGNFATLLPLVGTWMNAYGSDPNTLGTFYARVQEGCEPAGTANSSTHFPTIHGGINDFVGHCGASGLSYLPNGEAVERANTVEAGSALIPYFLIDPTNNKAFVDTSYGAIFGYCPYTQGGGATYYCDANYITTELADGALSSFKWTGFFFGMGGLFSNSWPSLRQTTGIQPTITTTCPLPSGIINIPYSQTLTATGDTPISWTISSGTLPTGLSLVSDTITGTPSVGGASSFSIQASNAIGNATNGPLSCSITISSITGSKLGGLVKTGGLSKR